MPSKDYEVIKKHSRKWKTKNVERVRAYAIAWYNRPGNKERKQDYDRLRRFGITREQYEQLLNAQGRKCAICGVSNEEKKLRIDHNHETGKFRGMLCNRCNRTIGMFEDSPRLVGLALNYLLERES